MRLRLTRAGTALESRMMVESQGWQPLSSNVPVSQVLLACACSFSKTQSDDFNGIPPIQTHAAASHVVVFEPDKQLAGNQILWGHKVH